MMIDIRSIFGNRATLLEALRMVAQAGGDLEIDADAVYAMLPPELQQAPAIYDGLTRHWRYEFGKTFEIGTIVLTGTEQFNAVDHLYLSCRAIQRLSVQDLATLTKPLSIPMKHRDALGEIAPLLLLKPEDLKIPPQYEVTGYGEGNKQIDWLFQPLVGPPILLDVKYRIGNLLSHTEQVHQSLRQSQAAKKLSIVKNAGIPRRRQGEEVKPAPEPEGLFKSTVDKFKAQRPDTFMQGAWIHTKLKIEETSLRSYYAGLDQEKIHFAIIDGFMGSAYLLSRDDIDRAALLSFFGLTEGNDAVY